MESTRIAIIGCGMSGILAGVRLQHAGITDFVVLEKASDIGGTWRDNRYPGLRCDVPAHMFVYSFKPNPEYSHRFAAGHEIQAYLEGVFEEHRLEPHVRLNCSVNAVTWDGGRWIVSTSGGEIAADCVVSACGILHHPKLPDIPGRETFEGLHFHTACWPNQLDLSDKRVGIIGTGSTAVQVVPALANTVASLNVYQRTPHWIFPMPNKNYSEADKQRLRKSSLYAHWLRHWYSFLFRYTFNRAVIGNKVLQFLMQKMCERNIRLRVKDRELARRLTPDYKAGCKRLVFAKGYYQALQQENVSLVTESITSIEPKGVRVASGQKHDLDVLIYATGFHAHNYMRPIEVVGRNGVKLNELWSDGAFAHRSMAIPGFPNFFVMSGPHSPIGNYSAISVAEVQFDYILHLLKHVRNCRVNIEPKAEITARLLEKMRASVQKTVWLSGCNSWYLDSHGVPPLWPWTFERFAREMKKVDVNEFDMVASICSAEPANRQELTAF